MRNEVVLLATAAALVAVAACNRSDEAAPSTDDQAPAAENVAEGTATPADHAAVMKARHDHYEEMGDAMKAIGVQLKADSPAVSLIQQHAATIARYGPQVLTYIHALELEPPGANNGYRDGCLTGRGNSEGDAFPTGRLGLCLGQDRLKGIH